MKKSISLTFILSTLFYSSICFAQDLKTTSLIKDSQLLANFENKSSQAIRINSVQVLSPTKSGVESKILKNIVVSLTLSPGSSAPISVAPVQLVREWGGVRELDLPLECAGNNPHCNGQLSNFSSTTTGIAIRVNFDNEKSFFLTSLPVTFYKIR